MLTATSRLARELHAQFDAAMRERGERLWSTPRILPLSNWVEECWSASSPTEVALSSEQDRFLWQQVILASPEADELLQIAGAASSAQEAWRLVREWQLPVSEARFIETADGEAFLRWLRAHQNKCEQQEWIDPPRLMDRVAGLVESIERPALVVLAGFDEITPQMTGLLTALEQAGTRWELMAAPRRGDVHASLSVCRDAEHELRAAAEWAREIVEKRPSSRVGVVVADLAQVRGMAERIFTEVLNPEVALLDAPESSRAFHISLGGKFADDPLVHSALLVLDLAHESLSLDRIGSLLRSPFLGSAMSERSGRALTDALLRQPHPSQVTVALLLEACRKHAPLLARMIEKWNKLRRALPQKALPSVWSGHFARLLSALEWPGSEALTTREHQAVGEWEELLSRFATLDSVTGPATFSGELSALGQLASNAGFQSENEGQPVQIMGIPETAGLEFDYLWIAGMTDEVWPRRPSPNPFLPISLQRSAGLPRSTARRELDYAVRTTSRLLNCAATVVVSCAEREEDRELRPSPLFTELDRRDIPQVIGALWPAPAELEGLTDSVAPAVLAGLVPHGGTRILDLQAKCPFRAFAEIRLGARSLEVSEAGLNARDRGSLLHIVLEHVWTAIGTQAALKALSDADLRALIRDGIAAAFRHKYHRGAFEDAFEREVRLIETSRLEALLSEWLAFEKVRAAPFSVDSREQQQRVSIGDLQFDARIDRVDRLASGREVIIDYKTGEVSTAQWEGERPDSPQVPLYAIAHERPIGALAFAKIQADGCKFDGIAQESNALPNVEQGDVAARLAEWRVVFERLAKDFLEGDARVDPKTYPTTCDFCQLGALCRITPVEVEVPE